MLLSVVVLSYNRPKQIERILSNLLTVPPGDYNLIIKDDCSPKGREIGRLIEVYRSQIKFEIIFHKNKVNMGYDGNLLDAFSISNSEYVFLISDDDYVDGGYFNDVVSTLERRDHKVYFTPYNTCGRVCRNSTNKYEFNKFHQVIYNSILFSGLIFHRRTVLDLKKDLNFLSNCIYTQVYLASVIVFNEGNYGMVSSDFLHLGGDGENFFGKNASAINRELLRDRSGVVANLRYQVFLLKVVEKIADVTDKRVLNLFMREYNIRFVGYLLRIRWVNFNAYSALLKEVNLLGIKFNVIAYFASILIYIMPSILCGIIYRLATKKFRKSG